MNYKSTYLQREEVATFMRRLYANKLTTCSGGNLSTRIDEKYVVITPSALDKGTIQTDQIALLTIDGENLTPHLKMSIETEMHLAIYRANPDIRSIVHAHPPMATSFTAMNVEIDNTLTGEAFLVVGNIAQVPYIIMGTKELADVVAQQTKNSNVVLMKNHGVTAVGPTMLKAYDRLEVLEAAAQMTINTKIMNSVQALSSEALQELNDWKSGKLKK